MHYPFSVLEKKWQSRWVADRTFAVSDDTSKPKYFVLDMFPYPSGQGLHIGHPEGYTATDIVSRFKRMMGYNVLHPMGFDAFGLPTERQAMTENVHPSLITARNIETFTRQLNAIGFDYDWSHSVNTTTPDYYRWTQWMFLVIYNSWYDRVAQRARNIDELPIPFDITDPLERQLYVDEHRLAFIANIPVNWCEALGTVLANEEVDEWKDKGYTVERKPMRQWMLRITEYAERLLADLATLDWPSSTLDMQRHWIGRSDGAEIRFDLEGALHHVMVFTTRPDTVFGATYLVLAPEHPIVEHIVSEAERGHVLTYRNAASLKSDLERTELNKSKTGVFTGAYAINPATHERVQIWVADYVLAHYGTGAIMAVPGHDERDHEFARMYSLPITQVVQSPSKPTDVNAQAFSDYGISTNSENADVSLNGRPSLEAIQHTIVWLENSGIGKGRVQYRLRDWLFSRQRYWGEPMPIMFFEDGTRRALDPEELPLLLPNVDSFQPAGTGESPLATIDTWVNFVDAKTGKRARYETNTMPQWAGSCWYFLRYTDPKNNETFADPAKERYWMGPEGVDLYVGGGEHAVLHLLYARFWHKVMYDHGYVSTPEPFKRLFHQGLILNEDGRKMSKSLGNTVNPDDIVASHGADALRLFEMFLGPLESSKPWNSQGIDGISRFLDRAWRLIVTDEGTRSPTVQDVACTPEQDLVLHTTIKKTREDIELLSLNTSVAQFMIFVNEFTPAPVRPRIAMKQFVQCLAPFAPHIAEELWSVLGESGSVHVSAFPEFDESKLVANSVEIVIQVSSRIRGKITVPTNTDDATLEKLALMDEGVQKHIGQKQIRKTIVVRDKLVNFICLLALAMGFSVADAQPVWFGGPFKVGAVPIEQLQEASGMASSTVNPNVIWLNNDSGDEPRLYAMNPSGRVIATMTLSGATNRDWEDIAYGLGPEIGDTFLYAADIGDNEAKRPNVTIYRVAEPTLAVTEQKQAATMKNVSCDAFTFTYPDGARDAETFLVDPLSQDFYIISKRDKQCRMYRAAAPHTPGTTTKLEFVGTLPSTLITGGDVSHDGKQILLKNYLFTWHWDRKGNEPLSATLKRPGRRVTYMPEEQGEAICFTSNNDGFYTTSEREEGGDAAPVYFYPRVKSEKEAHSSRDAKIPQISVAPSKDIEGIYDLRYVIPEVSRVHVTVHNSIMVKVLDIANESGESGVQEREIDLIDQPSGTYVAVIKTNNSTVMVPIEHIKP